jgi:MinD-like ATPase involved in chromosome partitioning or flagellar assembly
MLVVVMSAKGSPGASTAALALAAAWPQEWQTLLVECDPAGGDLQTGFGLASEPSLSSLAAAGRREHRSGLAWQHAQRLPGGLAVVPAPVRADHASRAVETLTNSAAVSRLGEPDDDATTPQVVVLDAGRLSAQGAMSTGVFSGLGNLTSAADVVVLVLRNTIRSVAHAVDALDTIGDLLRRRVEVRLLLVGPPGYTEAEVAQTLGLPVIGSLPWDERAAAALNGEPVRRPKSLGRSALFQAASATARRLVDDVDPHQPTRPRTRQPVDDLAPIAAPGPQQRNGLVSEI